MSRTHKTVSISLTPELIELAKNRAIELGFKNSFSAYVAKLVEEDVNAHTQPETIQMAGVAAAAASAVVKQRKSSSIRKP